MIGVEFVNHHYIPVVLFDIPDNGLRLIYFVEYEFIFFLFFNETNKAVRFESGRRLRMLFDVW